MSPYAREAGVGLVRIPLDAMAPRFLSPLDLELQRGFHDAAVQAIAD